MNRQLNASVVVDLTGNLQRQARKYGQSIQQFSSKGQRHLFQLSKMATTVGNALDNMGNRYTAALAGGLSLYKAKQQIEQSASLDKQLIQLAQTAGVTISATTKLRSFLFELSKTTGKTVDELLMGLNSLIQSGQSWEEALATIGAINSTMAVTSAQAEVLASSMTVAAKIFDFDLTKPEKSVELLDQMTVAGRLGNAELEDLSSIFARVGGNAKAANLSFTDTLGFIEQLSLIEKQPERLATLADSTLRLFTNQKYLENAAKVTGVSFYDAKGDRRAAFDVLDDISKKYQKLKSDIDKDKAIAAAFGQTDQDTIRGLRTLLEGGAVDSARKMSAEIAKAGGTIDRDLNDALNNSIDQVARLKAALREAADSFAQPINDAIGHAVKYFMDERGLSGKEMLAGGAIGAAALFAGVKGGGKLLKHVGSLGAGVATGKVMEEMAGVTPVYVVNMPGAGFDGLPGMPGGKAPNVRIPGRWDLLKAAPNMRAIGAMGAGAIGTAGLAVAGAGAAGYAAGTVVNKLFIEGTDIGNTIGRSIAQALAFMGNDNAQSALASERAAEKMERAAERMEKASGKVEVEFKNEPAARMKVSGDGINLDVISGVNVGAH